MFFWSPRLGIDSTSSVQLYQIYPLGVTNSQPLNSFFFVDICSSLIALLSDLDSCASCCRRIITAMIVLLTRFVCFGNLSHSGRILNSVISKQSQIANFGFARLGVHFFLANKINRLIQRRLL